MKNLRSLTYSSGAIALVGILSGIVALDRVNQFTARADSALVHGTMATPAPGARPGARSPRPALATYEHATGESSRATLYLALAGTLTPLLLFLNVLGHAGHTWPGLRRTEFRPVRLDENGEPDPSQLILLGE